MLFVNVNKTQSCNLHTSRHLLCMECVWSETHGRYNATKSSKKTGSSHKIWIEVQIQP